MTVDLRNKSSRLDGYGETTCRQCGIVFTRRRPHAVFCCAACQQAWHYAERKRLMAIGRKAEAKTPAGL
jgi:hypothetical protein